MLGFRWEGFFEGCLRASDAVSKALTKDREGGSTQDGKVETRVKNPPVSLQLTCQGGEN